MSAKFRRQQKKRRWSECGTVFPHAFVNKLSGISSDNEQLPGVRKVAAELLNLANLRFTYGEVEDLKHIISALQSIPDEDPHLPEFQQAAALMLELLFLDNSRPLHRHILSHFKKLTPKRADAVGDVLVQRILEEVENVQLSAFHSETVAPAVMPTKVALGQAICSLLWLGAPARPWLRRCCGPVVSCISRSIHNALQAAEAGAHVAPTLMLDIQDAISAVYYLLQNHGPHMAALEGNQGRDAITTAATMAFGALQGHVLVREALASAAVVVWAASILPQQSPFACLLHFAAGLLDEGTLLIEDETVIQHEPAGVLEEFLNNQGSSLIQELKKCSPLGRICTLKGLLTSIPMPAMCTELKIRLNNNQTPNDQTPNDQTSKDQPPTNWNWLSKGVLSTACRAVSDSKDAHFKFHAMCVVNITLQQIVASWQQAANQPGGLQILAAEASSATVAAEVTEELSDLHIDLNSDDEDSSKAGTKPVAMVNNRRSTPSSNHTDAATPLFRPVRLDVGDRDMLMNLLWSNLDEPLSQTVRQVQESFDSLLTVLSLQEQYMGPVEAAKGLQPFMRNTAVQLLASSYNRKGRYLPLGSLVSRLGSKALLELQPDLVQHTLRAMQDDMVSNSASAFFKTLIQDLRSQCGSSESGDDWKRWWMPALMAALYSNNDKLRQYVSVHAVPVLLAVEPALLLDLISSILSSKQAAGSSSQVAALVAVLKAGRSLQLLGDLDTLQAVGGNMDLDPRTMLMEAACHGSEALRLDCLELACVNPRESEAPGELEVALVARWLQYNLRCTNQGLRNKCMAVIARMLRRVRTSVHAALHRLSVKSPGAQGGKHSATARRSRSVNVLGVGMAADGMAAQKAEDPVHADKRAVARMQAFMHSFTAFLLACLYPGAPYQRKYFALELMNQVLDTWLDATWIATPLTRTPPGPDPYAALHTFRFQPWCDGFLSLDNVQLLLGNVVDSWDKLRQSAMVALMKFPNPLPGLDTPAQLLPLIKWAYELSWSPRVRESDAGARLAKFFFNKYTVQLCWHVSLYPGPSVAIPENANNETINSHDQGCSEASFEAQYLLLESLLLQLEAHVEEGARDLLGACSHSLAHGTLLSLRYLVEDVAWSELSRRPQQLSRLQLWFERLLAALMALCRLAVPCLCKPQDFSAAGDDMEDEGDVQIEEEGGEDGAAGLGSDAQIIITGCWTSVKEAALLLGTIAQHVPLPGELDMEAEFDPTVGPDAASGGSLLRAEQLGSMGQLLLELLFRMKHNGAVEKSALGLTGLCQRLLRCSTASLNQLPAQWLQACFKHLMREGQCLDDIVRRSSGIPFAFCALFLAEPANTPRVLLPAGLAKLLSIATAKVPADKWQQVHAFNTLRMTFNDSNMAVDTSGFFAEGVEASVLALAGPHWEVRNAASLCFTALCTRVLGFKNMANADAACKRSVTGSDFFLRYPALHSFLLAQLQEAAQSLEAGGGSVHPSLYPVLIILSRLRPSLLLQDSKDPFNLSPTAFTPVVQSCASARYLAVRHLAARALCPLVAPLDLPKMVKIMLQGLPQGPPVANHNATHGQMLLVRHLLENNAPMMDSKALGLMLQDLLPLVESNLIYLSFSCPCATIRMEGLTLLDCIIQLGLARHSSVLANLASHIRLQCVRTLTRPLSPDSDYHDPGHSLALKTTVSLLLGPLVHCLVDSNPEPEAAQQLGTAFGETVLELLQSPSYEIRGECLKRLPGVLSEGGLRGIWDEKWRQELQALLWKNLDAEPHYKVQRRMLDVLGQLQIVHPSATLSTNNPSIQSAETASVSQSPPNLDAIMPRVSMLQGMQHHRVRDPWLHAEWLKCYGHAVGTMLQAVLLLTNPNGHEGAANGESSVLSFLERVRVACGSTEPEESRLAAVAALAASKLTVCRREAAQQITWLEAAVVKVWRCVVHLMEDEEEDVRIAAAKLAQGSLPQGFECIDSGGRSLAGQTNKYSGVLYVEAVVRAVFEYVSHEFGSSGAWFGCLQDMVLEPQELDGLFVFQTETGSVSKGGTVVGGIVVRRLFDKETDNHYEEPLLLAQLAALHMHRLLNEGAVDSKVQQQALQQYCAAASCLARLCCALTTWQQRTTWLGSVTSHPELLVPLCRTLLALWATQPTARTWLSQVESNSNIKVESNSKVESSSDIKVESSSDIKVESSSKVESSGDIKVESSSDIKVESSSKVESSGDIKVESNSDIKDESSSDINICVAPLSILDSIKQLQTLGMARILCSVVEAVCTGRQSDEVPQTSDEVSREEVVGLNADSLHVAREQMLFLLDLPMMVQLPIIPQA